MSHKINTADGVVTFMPVLHEDGFYLSIERKGEDRQAVGMTEEQVRELCNLLGAALTTPPAAPVQEPPDDGFTQALIERDEYHAIADELAEMIAKITGEDIGEHTSANFPWRNALDAAENWLCHPPAAQRQWVSLTEDALKGIFKEPDLPAFVVESARAIDAWLREKNGGQA